MIILYSSPPMFGLSDSNPFGLKVETFLKISKIPYRIENILDMSQVPHKQLPYIDDEGKIMSDSNQIISYLSEKHKLQLDNQLIEAQKKLQFLITRMLDNHLYWVISYSRWQDEQYWPLFKDEFLKQMSSVSESNLEKEREHNIQKYDFQGIGRYERKAIYQSGIDDLMALNSLLGDNKFLFGGDVHTIDACCYGFLANIYFFDIDTPLRNYLIDETALGQYTARVKELLD